MGRWLPRYPRQDSLMESPNRGCGGRKLQITGVATSGQLAIRKQIHLDEKSPTR